MPEPVIGPVSVTVQAAAVGAPDAGLAGVGTPAGVAAAFDAPWVAAADVGCGPVGPPDWQAQTIAVRTTRAQNRAANARASSVNPSFATARANRTPVAASIARIERPMPIEDELHWRRFFESVRAR